MVNCTMEGCDKPVFAKGLCSAHYQRERRLLRHLDPPVRLYGVGFKRVSGSVTDERYEKLKKYADQHHAGRMHRLVQEVLSQFADELE